MSSTENILRKEPLLGRLSGHADFETIIDDWISDYKENHTSAMVELIQLLTDSAGHNTKLTIEIIESNEPQEVINSLKASIPTDRTPPITAKQIRVNMAVFIQRLIQKCNSLLFDNYLLDTFFAFAVPLSTSSLRVFRMVGTLVGLKAMTALLTVLKVSSDDLLIAKQQLAAEEAKYSTLQSSDHMELLQSKVSELQNNEKEITSIVHDFLIKIIFKQRILDKQPVIQVLCISEAVLWMEIHPNSFFNDHYLIYYKMFMRSPAIPVRQEILRSLLCLYEKERYKDKLEVFTTRSIPDLICLITDQSIPVSILALNLLTKILIMYGPQIFHGQRKGNIFRLVFSKFKQIACEAGAFLIAWLNARTDETTDHVSILMYLVLFFEKANLPNHAPFMVEALLTNCPALLDWQAMSEVLIYESDNMSPEQERCFLRIMHAVMNQACSGMSPRTRNGKPLMTSKAVRMRETHKLKITEYFTEHLPHLLHKYRDSEKSVVMLLEISKQLKFERIIPAKEQIVDELIKCLENLTEIHSDQTVLRGCCEVMECINSEFHTAVDSGSTKWQTFESIHFEKFMQAVEVVQKCNQTNITPNADQIFVLSNSLEKLLVFYEYKDQGWTELWSICLNYITHSLNDLMFPITFIIDCIKVCHLIILWDRARIETDNDVSVTEEQAACIQSKILEFLYVLEQLLAHKNSHFRIAAFFVTCDILLTFCINSSPVFPTIGVSAHSSLQYLLQKYIENNVLLGDHVEQMKRGLNLGMRLSILMAYCKLVTYGMLEIKEGVWLFKYYGNTEKEFTDVLNKTFTDMLETDPIESAQALMQVLTNIFKYHMKGDRSLESIKKILKNKCESFTNLLSGYSNALMYFHKDGIFFAYEEGQNNKLLLEVMMDHLEAFTPRQLSDLNDLVKLLEERSNNKSESAVLYQKQLLKILKAAKGKKRPSLMNNESKTTPSPAKICGVSFGEGKISPVSLNNSNRKKSKKKVSLL